MWCRGVTDSSAVSCWLVSASTAHVSIRDYVPLILTGGGAGERREDKSTILQYTKKKTKNNIKRKDKKQYKKKKTKNIFFGLLHESKDLFFSTPTK